MTPETPQPPFEVAGFDNGQWAEWYRLTPQDRWAVSQKLWALDLARGGSLDPDPDPESPFYDAEEWKRYSDGKPILHISRRDLR